MACTSVTIPTSPLASTAKDFFKEHNNGLHRSNSAKDLLNKASLRRSYSDNHLCYSVNRIRATSTQPKLKNSRSVGIFPFQISDSIIPTSLRSFLFDPKESKDMIVVEKDDRNMVDDSVESNEEEEELKRANWVERLMEIRRHWRNRKQKEIVHGETYCDDEESVDRCDFSNDDEGCQLDYNSDEEEEEEVTYDRESFSKFLVEVPWSDTKLFSKLAFLCNMAYVIPEIKEEDLRRYYGLQFITSSLEKKAEAAAIKAKLEQDSTHVPVTSTQHAESSSGKNDSGQKHVIHPTLAYEIAASAASYVQTHKKDLKEDESTDSCRNRGQLEEREGSRAYKNSEVAAYMAASTMTAVVAAGEKEKQKAAKDLQSLHSSPCEWFICDDSSTYTRCFVIQGSDSLASWQANLFFEPTKFEETDVLVHRGIYEAAKGIYEQFMPAIVDHVKRYGERAKLQFTGHSLGGSLSLLVNLMLLTRKAVKPSTLRPVVTFGSPFVFCGGRKILNDLGLDESHIHCVTLHRDIVPRAFSCNYHNHVATLLKRLNGPFRSHPCLVKHKMLYTPLGKIFILQPDERSSPPHPLLPRGTAFYALDKASPSVLKAFLNCPHPLETLSNPTAYGSEGTILRDHDSSNYLKAMNGVLRQYTKPVASRARKQRNQLWPLLTSPSPHSWSHENNIENSTLQNKEVMTGV
ncbi:hypothetical protein HS088_TW17G00656 [Tripterygium wilfordii]|uniref:Fungal lipase-type domain-containing protein n=1 Tax=Tripterygium wilfordii TaxID=458696 RepID=A0A7J7CGF1_TRIWF|nr:phospholipase A1 PLIP1, chloroplastic [Tripterygium wilfordii]XP_038681245.1 phospholipase A1 PLIP1, chloroplastic [Tripterygium wilfordii]KAF5733120.1 hypothetical protein HS088_TW17G00656 [Tripterygium wilfordii]